MNEKNIVVKIKGFGKSSLEMSDTISDFMKEIGFKEVGSGYYFVEDVRDLEFVIKGVDV